MKNKFAGSEFGPLQRPPKGRVRGMGRANPIKAGKGKLKQTWYWPVYGEANELCFSWSRNRGKDHVVDQLGDFAGTLLSTCRLHDVDPYTYLVDVLQRIALHPARDVEQLTPRCWKALYADTPLRLDLEHAR